MTDTEGTPPQADLIACRQCGHDVPRLEYCIRCGDPLADEYSDEARRAERDRFAAAPHERAGSVAVISTLFPQLPRAEMRTFRLALVAGTAIVVGLALAGFFPVALVASAVLVPLLMVLYLYVVDVYEDEPLPIIGATMAWGMAAGVVYGLLLRGLPQASPFGAPDPGALIVAAVGLPLVEGALMIAGPLVLLPWRRFNDVLDGATFGAASAVSFAGAHLIVQSLDILGAGLRPDGDPLPWVVQVISLAVLQPVVAAGSVGAAAAAFWLRYRAPVTDRHALGMVGNPLVATAAAAVLLVAAGAVRALLPLNAATVALAAIAIVALLWLRRALHLGLLQEAREISVERSIICPNCSRETPEHTFCGHCGVALRALPRSAARPPAPGSGGADEPVS